jgi:hypothetical protein
VIRDENKWFGGGEMLAAAHPKPDKQRHERFYRQRKRYHLSDAAKG